MGKDIVVYGAMILSLINIVYLSIIEICDLRKDIPKGRSCIKLKNEQCSTYIWGKIFFQQKSYCNRERCPGFIYYENGKQLKKFSLLSVLEIIIKQSPALVALILLLLHIFE